MAAALSHVTPMQERGEWQAAHIGTFQRVLQHLEAGTAVGNSRVGGKHTVEGWVSCQRLARARPSPLRFAAVYAAFSRRSTSWDRPSLSWPDASEALRGGLGRREELTLAKRN